MNALFEVMTTAEACELWGLSESTLRVRINRKKLQEGIDYRKSGKGTLITVSKMKELYGEPKKA